MSDQKMPQIPSESKVKILLIQREMLAAQQQLNLLKTALADLLNQIAIEMNISDEKLMFDLDKLTVVPKG